MTPIRIVRSIALQRRHRRRLVGRSGVWLVLRFAAVAVVAVVFVIAGIVASAVRAVGGYGKSRSSNGRLAWTDRS